MAQQDGRDQRASGGEAPPSGPQAIERLVGALQDPTRRGILLAFYDEPRARTVDEVAAGAGVHRTVAFSHLERLVALGFLSTTQRRGGLGKPAKLYHLVAGPLELHHPARQFAALAGLLAESLQRFGDDGVEAARDAGRRQGEALGGRGSSGERGVAMAAATGGERPHGTSAGGDRPQGAAPAVPEALIPLALLGATYTVDGDRVLARNCIFREACARAPMVVCHLHAGMIEGALAAAGTPRRADPCDTGDDHAACAYRLSELAAPAWPGSPRAQLPGEIPPLVPGM